MRVYVDCETTGLDPRIHWAYEVAILNEHDDRPNVLSLPHSLEYADAKALEIGRYYERGFRPFVDEPGQTSTAARLLDLLHGKVIVGQNPGFDASFLTKAIGATVWNYHLIDVAQAGMWLFGWDEPHSLSVMVKELRERGYTISEPEHTAASDVLCVASVHDALKQERARLLG